jgi:hypothetical protein
MNPIKPTTYVFDFRSTLNCAHAQSLRPGDSTPLLVRGADDLQSPNIVATAYRSNDGLTIRFQIQPPDETQDFSWNYEWLMEAIELHRGTAG